MLSVIESWFTPVTPSLDYRRSDYILLILILAAGVWVRFWHLGNVGLHGDEDIMGLAARGIVAHGIPILPSDMLYLRAPVHTYLIAGSMFLFGDSEWSLRMPSAVMGSLCGFLAYFLGRRFLDPIANLAFVALITFLPAMIEISQTARMYVFFVASVVLFGITLFRFERSGTVMSWLLAFVVLVIAIQFHRLAVFAAPLFLYPGLANRSWKQLLQGTIALPGAVVVSELAGYLSHWNYPEESERLVLEEVASQTPFELLFQGNLLLVVAIAIGLIAAVIAVCTIKFERWRSAIPAILLFAFGVVSCATLNYHIGMIALILGAIAWFRADTGKNFRLLVLGLAIGLIALVQYQFLQASGEFAGRKIIGAFVGTPSIWPTLQITTFSPIGAAILVTSVAFAAWHLARKGRIPVYFLFFGLAVWVPVAAIGLFTWYSAERYTIGPLAFFLLSSVAGLVYLANNSTSLTQSMWRSTVGTIVGIVTIAAMINPVAAWRVVRNDYQDHPDHKGAAEYIRQLGLGPKDVVIAEDSIVQAYYLGMVDYRLQNVVGAQTHALLKGGILYDQYTGARVIGSGQEFDGILRKHSGDNVYVISSGQVSDGLMRRNRGNGIAEILASDRLEMVHLGRDGRTTVWRKRR